MVSRSKSRFYEVINKDRDQVMAYAAKAKPSTVPVGAGGGDFVTDEPVLTEGDVVFVSDDSGALFELASAEAGKEPKFILTTASGPSTSDPTFGDPDSGFRAAGVRFARIVNKSSVTWTPGLRLVVVNTDNHYHKDKGNIRQEGDGEASAIIIGLVVEKNIGLIDLPICPCVGDDLISSD